MASNKQHMILTAKILYGEAHLPPITRKTDVSVQRLPFAIWRPYGWKVTCEAMAGGERLSTLTIEGGRFFTKAAAQKAGEAEAKEWNYAQQ